MNLPNALTVSRIILAPVLFLLIFVPVWTGQGFLPCYVLAWLLFIYIEVSDVVDGHLARKLDLVSELGKILDPFSDVLSRMTYFVAFVALGIMPAWMLLAILYRELAINFMRSALFNRGIAMAARRGGKLKAILYGVAGGAGLMVIGVQNFGLAEPWANYAQLTALVVFGAAVTVSLLSFVDYAIVFAKLYGKKDEQ